MEKIVFFVEWSTELIFVREILPKILWFEISINCMELRSNKLKSVKYNYWSPESKLYFLIIDVWNDEKVLSVIKEREKSMIKNWYKKIIRLRDMYSEKYLNKTKKDRKIDKSVTNKFIKSAQDEIKLMNNSDKISLHFAIMEIEAWFLAFYQVFEKINPKLTCKFMKNITWYNLKDIDPQTEFFKPSTINMKVSSLECFYFFNEYINEKNYW